MDAKQTERGIALLRIVFGFWLIRSSMAHLVWNPWPWASAGWVQYITTQLAEHSLSHPSFWVRYFIQQALLPNAEAYVGVMQILELLAGISLAFGLITVAGGALAFLLALGQGLLVHYTGEVVVGYYLFQGSAALVFLATRAGRRWGFDTLLAGMKERSVLW